MLYFLLALTFCVGILIHGVILHLPRRLRQSWNQDCTEYLQSTTHKNLIAAPTEPSRHINWWLYLPFFSFLIYFYKSSCVSLKYATAIFILDVALLISSLCILNQFDSYLYWGGGLIFTWLLITSSFIDFEHQILPDELTYILLWTGLLASCNGLFTYSTSAILGAFIAYSALYVLSFLFKLIRKKEGIGQGDLKLFAAIGSWTGVMSLPLILFLASLFSLIFIIMRKLFFRQPCSAPASFGPFLALAGWLVLLWGNDFSFYLHL